MCRIPDKGRERNVRKSQKQLMRQRERVCVQRAKKNTHEDHATPKAKQTAFITHLQNIPENLVMLRS